MVSLRCVGLTARFVIRKGGALRVRTEEEDGGGRGDLEHTLHFQRGGVDGQSWAVYGRTAVELQVGNLNVRRFVSVLKSQTTVRSESFPTSCGGFKDWVSRSKWRGTCRLLVRSASSNTRGGASLLRENAPTGHVELFRCQTRRSCNHVIENQLRRSEPRQPRTDA